MKEEGKARGVISAFPSTYNYTLGAMV
jgi:hypothetical protein